MTTVLSAISSADDTRDGANLGFFDKVKSSVNDISNSVSGAIDDQKTNMKVRDEQKKIDQVNTEIGKIVADCMMSGKEFNESMIADQMTAIIDSMRTICELKGEPFNIDYDPSARSTYYEPEPAAEEETAEETAPVAEVATAVVTAEVIEEKPVEETRPKNDFLAKLVSSKDANKAAEKVEEPITEPEPVVEERIEGETVVEEQPVEEDVVEETVQEEPKQSNTIESESVTLASTSVPNRMSGRFRSFMEATITASSYCSKWNYVGSDEVFDTDSLIAMAEIHDAENQLDDDSFYIVLEDGSIGVKKDCEAVEWAFIPSDAESDIRDSFDEAVRKNGPSMVGFSSKINDPEVLGTEEGPGDIWYGMVLDRNTDTEFSPDGEETEVYRTIVRKSDGTLHTIEERGNNPMYLWLSKGDRVRYIPFLDAFEKYDKSVDIAMPCLMCGCMNDIGNDRCCKCNKPLFK